MHFQNPEGSDLSRQQNSHLPGTSETGSVGGGSGRSGSSRSGHDSIRSELKYLTDFFPDQNPSDRRLTRSQRQYSTPVSNVSFFFKLFLRFNHCCKKSGFLTIKQWLPWVSANEVLR